MQNRQGSSHFRNAIRLTPSHRASGTPEQQQTHRNFPTYLSKANVHCTAHHSRHIQPSRTSLCGILLGTPRDPSQAIVAVITNATNLLLQSSNSDLSLPPLPQFEPSWSSQVTYFLYFISLILSVCILTLMDVLR